MTLVVFLRGKGYLLKLFKRQWVIIKISEKNINFTKEILDYFPFYIDTIEVDMHKRLKRIDFSGPRKHLVSKFINFPFWFPSVPEPIVTIDQYLEILELQIGETVIDLGAYSGLSSIVFKEAVGDSGTVVAVEADPKNFRLLEENLMEYKKETNQKVEYLHAAAFSSSGVMSFISEGTMASSLKETAVDGWIRESVMTNVPTVTLEDIVQCFKLEHVNVIKADIEGSEYDVFSLASFFREFRPRVLVEIPSLDESKPNFRDLDMRAMKRNLFHLFESYDYESCQYHQIGSKLPLVLFLPK